MRVAMETGFEPGSLVGVPHPARTRMSAHPANPSTFACRIAAPLIAPGNGPLAQRPSHAEASSFWNRRYQANGDLARPQGSRTAHDARPPRLILGSLVA